MKMKRYKLNEWHSHTQTESADNNNKKKRHWATIWRCSCLLLLHLKVEMYTIYMQTHSRCSEIKILGFCKCSFVNWISLILIEVSSSFCRLSRFNFMERVSKDSLLNVIKMTMQSLFCVYAHLEFHFLSWQYGWFMFVY